MLNDTTHSRNSMNAGLVLSGRRSNTPPLPRSVQEHLGRTLRADYYEREEKPRFCAAGAI